MIKISDKEKLKLFEEEKEKTKNQMEKYAKEQGFNNWNEYVNNENDKIAQKKGYKNWNDWIEKEGNQWAIDRGYKNYDEYERIRKEKGNKRLPYDLNKECTHYLGSYIAENILPKVFDNPKRMKFGNIGYDFICKNGYKIDVKSSCLYKNNQWQFGINRNIITDYFLCISFDNRKYLNPLHIWLIKGNEIIKERKLNEFTALYILNEEYYIKMFQKYEISDKLDKIKNVCREFKEI